MSPRFSLILASAGNPELLESFLTSLVRTLRVPDETEVLIYFDRDAIAYRQLIWPGINLRPLLGEEDAFTASRALRTLAATAQGEYLVHVNDDVVFRTDGWDTSLLGVFAVHGNLCFPIVNSLLPTELNNFPILHRDVWNMIKAESFPYERFYIDTHIHDVYRRLRRLGHDVMIKLPNIIFQHNWVGGVEKHKTCPGAMGRDKVVFDKSAGNREGVARKIAEMIGEL